MMQGCFCRIKGVKLISCLHIYPYDTQRIIKLESAYSIERLYGIIQNMHQGTKMIHNNTITEYIRNVSNRRRQSIERKIHKRAYTVLTITVYTL